MTSVIVLRSESGKVTSEKVIEGDIGDVVRNTAAQALKEWNDMISDFIIMKDSQEWRVPLPLKPNDYERLKNFLSGKEKNEAILKLPIYIISFDNQWSGEDFQDKKVYVVSYYLDDEMKKELTTYAIDVTSENKGENEGEESEEGEEEE
ncbi:DUF2286 domain-containing protein [Candidatus Acidianus copahuensis]|uniref:DUF2286 domain-containing protein n=1 Tax=Candidatus Acidianus copahuensis TaxID=1160895 RepID=A0A031LRF6_9CREN|nr:DUF2286 domain-containing protein [Candidatus Acidianus copahuensis]EZQ06989.1 hypothetical protein CM19_06420 [Candidatus Acidianus copahuensis]NON61876.1 DUF2286 domain-containing protein [Acidianus sp. RZ1]